MGDLSKNFSSTEFKCPHCKTVHVEPSLVQALQLLRDRHGRAIQILSGYRCVTHNTKIGGEKRSLHIAGRAADIQIEGFDTKQTLEACLAIPELTGIGYYPDEHFVHVDTRPTKTRATWARVNGKYVSLEEGLKYAAK
jgi:uncharacterized protein YcbK (DUF882 family)